jgi:hypothetical protein
MVLQLSKYLQQLDPMGIKKYISLQVISLLSIIFIYSVGCRKPCRNYHYVFKGTGAFSPEEDSIKVGDTVWYSSSIPEQMMDTFMKQTIDYSGASNFATDINFTVVSYDDPTTGAIDSFLFIPGKGSVSNNPLAPKASKYVVYSEQAGNYEFSFGIVAQKKGIYSLTTVDIENSRKDCSDAYISLRLTNANTHQCYLNSIYFPGSPWGDVIPPIVQTHSYCFKVY